MNFQTQKVRVTSYTSFFDEINSIFKNWISARKLTFRRRNSRGLRLVYGNRYMYIRHNEDKVKTFLADYRDGVAISIISVVLWYWNNGTKSYVKYHLERIGSFTYASVEGRSVVSSSLKLIFLAIFFIYWSLEDDPYEGQQKRLPKLICWRYMS